MFGDDNQDTPFSRYWSLVNRRAAQEMDKKRWGSEPEAQSGGSSAFFRASDSPEYVSQVMAQSPVSFVGRYPDVTNQMRELHGLGVLGDTKAEMIGDANISGGLAANESQGAGAGFGFGLGIPSMTDIETFFADKAINIGFYFLAIVLILGGLLIIALSTDTGKAIAKDAAKAAVV